MPLKSLQQIAATKFASTYLAPNLEFLYVTPEKSQHKLIDFFVHNPPEICLKVILAISTPILRAQLFVFLQENANAIKDEIIEQRRKARSSYDDRAQETDTQTIHNDINDWRIALSHSLGVSNKLALDSSKHIDAFNEKMKSLLSKANFIPIIPNIDSVYYNPLSAFLTSRKHDASDIVSLAVLGLLPTLQQTYSALNDADKQAAIKALVLRTNRYTAFELTIKNDHLETVQWIYEKLEETDKQAALAADIYGIFRYAAGSGHLETAQWIYAKLEKTDDLAALTALTTYKYLAFQSAAGNGHLETAQWIYEKLDVAGKQVALAENDYGAFRDAAGSGHLETAQWIYGKLGETDKQAAVTSKNYAAFRGAARGHLKTVQWIYEKLGETTRQAALAALAENNYWISWRTAEDGHRETIPWLYEKLDTAGKQTALATLGQEDKYPFFLFLRIVSQNNNIPNGSSNLNLSNSRNFIESSSSSSSANVDNNVVPMIARTLTNN